MKRKPIAGVYQIRQISTGRLYIGGSANIYKRFGYHKSRLRTNKHWCKPLQDAWNTKGYNDFTFMIIEETTEYLTREKAYIASSKSNNPEYGFNTHPCADSIKTHCRHGHEYTPENTRYYYNNSNDRIQRICRMCNNHRYKRKTPKI